MSFTLSIDIPGTSSQTYTVNWPQTANAQTLLELAYDQHTYPGSTTPFHFGLAFYGTPPSGFGYLVSTINGTSETDSASGEYWQFLLNGQSSQYGIDETMLNDGDTVEFEYSPYNPDLHGITGPNARKAQVKAA